MRIDDEERGIQCVERRDILRVDEEALVLLLALEQLLELVDARVHLGEDDVRFLAEQQRANVRKIEGDYLSQRRISLYIKDDYVRERMLNTVVDTLKTFMPESMLSKTVRRPLRL